MNVTAPLRRLARRHPHAPALIRADDRVLSYAALDAAIDRLAVRLAVLDLAADAPVGLAIVGPDESRGLILAFALARLGIPSADPALPGTRQLAADPAWFNATDPAPEVPLAPGAARLLRVFASSGTTGAPKPVPVSHALMTRRVVANIRAPGGPDPCARIVAVNLGITWGFTAALRTLWQGGTLVLTNPREAASRILRHRVRTIVTAPTGLAAMLDALPAGTGPLPGLETIEIGGSVLPRPLRQAAAARLCPRLISYLGASEAGGIASAPLAALEGREGAVGFVHAGITVEAVDAADRPLPPGAEGRLRLRGPLLAAAGPDGWFYPGDLGTVWADGMLCLAGRAEDMMNCGGVKLSARAIEEALLGLPGVTEAAAFAVPDARGLDQPWAAIVAQVPIAAADIGRVCAAAQTGAVPRTVLQMRALPRTATGKVRKDLLVAFARAQPATPA